MSKGISRRTFIKGGLTALGAVSTAGIAVPSVVQGAAQDELATLIDIRKCIGCEACVEACQEVNEAKYPEPKKPFPKMYPSRVKVSDWSEKRDVTDRLTPYNWLTIQWATVDVDGEETELSFPKRCMHCQNPPCADLCPWGAARKLENGITVIHSDICLGGKKCQVVCPWDIPQRQTGVGLYLDILPSLAGNGVMYKCDRCYSRIAEGEMPACIEQCPEDVQIIGPRDEIVREAHRLVEEEGVYIYGETENGGTNTLYVSPVPYEILSQAISKGPGQPHFDQVVDQMAHADNLAKAMLIAPLAGLAAGVGRIYNASKKLSDKRGEDS